MGDHRDAPSAQAWPGRSRISQAQLHSTRPPVNRSVSGHAYPFAQALTHRICLPDERSLCVALRHPSTSGCRRSAQPNPNTAAPRRAKLAGSGIGSLLATKVPGVAGRTGRVPKWFNASFPLMTRSPTFSPPPRPRHRRKPVRPHPGVRHLGRRHRRRHGCIFTRIARRRSPHRAFRQSADPKLMVPFVPLPTEGVDEIDSAPGKMSFHSKQERRTFRARRSLQAVVAIFAVIPVLAGFAGVLLGPGWWMAPVSRAWR